MNDPVDSVLAAREALDHGLPAALALSGVVHAAVASVLVGAALFAPRPPLLQVAPGFVVALPPGGGGTPMVEAAAPPAPAAEPAAPPAPPPQVLKPPREQPKKGLPAPDARKKSRTEKPAAPAAAASPRPDPRAGASAAPRTPGLEFGPPGAGVPGGTDPAGDFYLASVQRKIWLVWTQQMRTDLRQPVGVTFTILADGSVTDVRVVQSSGVPLLDLAAQRAVFSAAPFAPLPRHYGTNRYTIQALFKPTT